MTLTPSAATSDEELPRVEAHLLSYSENKQVQKGLVVSSLYPLLWDLIFILLLWIHPPVSRRDLLDEDIKPSRDHRMVFWTHRGPLKTPKI